MSAFYTLRQGAAESEMNFRLAENQSVLSMTMDGTGNIYYIGYEEDPGDDGSGQMVPDLTFYKVDQQGVPLLTLDLAEYTRRQEPTLIQDMAVDGEDRIVLVSSNQNIYVLDPDGKLLFENRVDGGISDICSNGKVFIVQGSIDGVEFREIDIPGKKLSTKLAHNISGNQFYMAASPNGNLLIATENSVYQYDPESTETVKKFDWQTYDVTDITAGILLPYGENGVLAVSRNYATVPMKTEVSAFREAAEGEVIMQEKTLLTLGVRNYIPTALNAEVVYFNKANPEVKIEVKLYDEDYTRLYTEVMAGNGLDLMLLPSDRVDPLAAGGVLKDLNPYFDGDKALDRSEFIENTLHALETEGHLYGMPVNFKVLILQSQFMRLRTVRKVYHCGEM